MPPEFIPGTVVLVLAGAAALAIVVGGVCSGRSEELDAATDWAGPARYRSTKRRCVNDSRDHETEMDL